MSSPSSPTSSTWQRQALQAKTSKDKQRQAKTSKDRRCRQRQAKTSKDKQRQAKTGAAGGREQNQCCVAAASNLSHFNPSSRSLAYSPSSPWVINFCSNPPPVAWEGGCRVGWELRVNQKNFPSRPGCRCRWFLGGVHPPTELQRAKWAALWRRLRETPCTACAHPPWKKHHSTCVNMWAGKWQTLPEALRTQKLTPWPGVIPLNSPVLHSALGLLDWMIPTAAIIRLLCWSEKRKLFWRKFIQQMAEVQRLAGNNAG